MILRFLQPAVEEYEDAVEYYERAQAGLGAVFVQAVEDTLELTLAFPRMGELVVTVANDQEIRRRVIQRFGVELDYMVADDVVIVVAIFHCRREPGYWRRRLRPLR